MKPSSFQFVNPYLIELTFNSNKNFEIVEDGVEIKNTANVNVCKCENGNCANVELDFKISTGDDSGPFIITAKVASDFTWDESIDNETVDKLLNLNAPALLLGFLRPIIANVTNVSKFPVYNIPFINLTA